MTSKESKTTTSGIQTLESGNRIIPSSTRADGSTRPERRVKPGFTPAEDVVRYQNRTAEAWRNRGSGGVPGATDKEEEGDEEEGITVVGGEVGEGDVPTTDTTAAAAAAPVKTVEEQTAAADAEKKAKGLQKKIRQAQELKARKEKGETLLPEQLDKALRLGELIRDLEKLGVKYEG
ncbi:hypothetical protein TWF281_003190 [Arthrobotrys megalospora]